MKRKLSWTTESVTFSIVEKWIKKKKEFIMKVEIHAHVNTKQYYCNLHLQ